ncbi:MAG: hypothetical protein SGILL_001645 [Bacillariaceae sp.]
MSGPPQWPPPPPAGNAHGYNTTTQGNNFDNHGYAQNYPGPAQHPPFGNVPLAPPPPASNNYRMTGHSTSLAFSQAPLGPSQYLSLGTAAGNIPPPPPPSKMFKMEYYNNNNSFPGQGQYPPDLGPYQYLSLGSAGDNIPRPPPSPQELYYGNSTGAGHHQQVPEQWLRLRAASSAPPPPQQPQQQLDHHHSYPPQPGEALGGAPAGIVCHQRQPSPVPPPPPPPLPPSPPRYNFRGSHEQQAPQQQQQQQPSNQLYPDVYRPPLAPPPPPPPPLPIVPQQVTANKNVKKAKKKRKRSKSQPPQSEQAQKANAQPSFAEQLDVKAAAIRQQQQQERQQRVEENVPVYQNVDDVPVQPPKKKRQRGKTRARNKKKAAIAAAEEATVSSTTTEVVDVTGDTKKAPQAQLLQRAASAIAAAATATQNASNSTALDNSSSLRAATDTLNNRKTNRSRQDLEEVRARLEQAKRKKLQMEQNLQTDSILEGTASATSTASTTNNSLNATETRSNASVASRSSKAQEAFDKLQAARSKLRGAMKNRERVMRTSALSLPPVSALSSSLIIRNISTSGPKEKVYISPGSTSSIPGMDRAAAEALLGKEMMDSKLCTTSTIDDGDPSSLATRKRQLQQELMALQEKLEKSQRAAVTNTENDTSSSNSAPTSPKRSPVVVTKEELEKRKAEAQNNVDVSYWKHFVSKQEHMLEQVTDRITENESALDECQKQGHETNKNLLQSQNKIDELESRKKIVEQGISSSMTALLQARQALYHARQTQTANSTK